MALSEQSRQKLDAIVARMEANGESPENIKTVVNDFKQKYSGGLDLSSLPGIAAPKNVVQRVPEAPAASMMDVLTGRYANAAERDYRASLEDDPKAAQTFDALKQGHAKFRGWGAGLLSGGGPVGQAVASGIGAKLTTPENAGGVGGASLVDLIASRAGVPNPSKLTMALRGGATGAGAIAGQQMEGREVSPGEGAAMIGVGAGLPPALKWLSESILTNPVANSLYTKSKNAYGDLKSLLGLAETTPQVPITAQAAEAADRTKRTITEPVRKAVEQKTAAVQRSASANVKANQAKAAVTAAEQELPAVQQQADMALAENASNALNKTMQKLVEEGHPITDVKGIPFLLVRKNPGLATKLVQNPSPENISEAIHMYNVDRAENVYKRLLAGRNPNNYEEMLDPETARVAKAVLQNPQGVPQAVIDKYYKPTINKIIPPYLKDVDNVQTLAEEAMRRNLAAKVNVNAPMTPETKAMGTINKTYNGTLKPGTATPEVPAGVTQARSALDSATQEKADATAAARLANTNFSNASRGARESYQELGITPAQLDRFRALSKTQPEVLTGGLAEGGEKAATTARGLVKLVGDNEETRQNLTTGTIKSMLDMSRDTKGNITNISQLWERNRPVFRELLGDEAKVDKMGSFLKNVQAAQDKLKTSGHGLSWFIVGEGIAAGIKVVANNNPASAATAAAVPTVIAIAKWPNIINAALTNPTVGKWFETYAKNAGTRAGQEAGRNIMTWIMSNAAKKQGATDKNQEPK